MRSSSDSEPEEDPAKRAAHVRLSTLGFQVVIMFVVLAMGGAWLDDQIGISPWGTLGGVGLGLVAMVKIMLREGTDHRPSENRSESSEASASDKDDSEEAIE
jgi:F0F1-type ATP synthase assembly protein I